MNDPCENYEVLISTWMDESLERDDQRELFDHFTRCSACRSFYRDARALEGLVAATSEESTLAENPSPAVWSQIESRTTREEKSVAGVPAWALRAAAVVVLGVALAFLPWPQSPVPARNANSVELVLEENRGLMTDGRFVELAAEVLRSDRRYHFAMQEVMEKVIEDEWDLEGATSEGLTDDSKSDEGEGEGESSPFRV